MNNSDFIKFNTDEIETQPNGYLSLLATITRTGVFTYHYMNELGEAITVRQLRHPDDVFEPGSLQSLMGIPLTNEHPHEFLEPENSANKVVGMASDRPKEITLDGNPEKFLRQQVTIFDPDTIEDVLSGHKRELSLGYTLDHDETPGVWNGEHYDVRQKNIRYNHLSVVKKARGGPLCRFNLDAEDIHVDGVCTDKVLNFNTVKGEDMIFNKDGKEYDVKDEVHALLTTLETEKKEAVDAVSKELTELKAEFDALQAKFDLGEKSKATDAAKEEFRTAVAARVKLEREACDLLGSESVDGLSDREIKEKVIAKSSKVSLDGKSDAYVDAAFDLIVENGVSNTDFGKTVAGQTDSGSDLNIVEAARKKAMERALNQWKGE